MKNHIERSKNGMHNMLMMREATKNIHATKKKANLINISLVGVIVLSVIVIINSI